MATPDLPQVPSAKSVPQVGDSAVIGVQRAGREIPLRIQYAAIREVREFLSAVPGASTGVLFGSSSDDSIGIDHAAPGPGPKKIIGFFRVQASGWPVLLDTDRQKMRDLVPSGGLLLIVRPLRQRPWQATLFAVNGLNPPGTEVPLAEFPFDEYLLRNGWLTDVVAPALPDPPPDSRTRNKTIGITAAILILIAAWRWIPMPGRPTTPTPDRAANDIVADGDSLALKLTPTAGSLEFSWNRKAEAVRLATSGALAIRNGPVTRVIELTREQLREGRILYLPLAGVDVDARLEVTTATGRTEAESVQLVGFNTAPYGALTGLDPSLPQRYSRQNLAQADRSTRPAQADRGVLAPPPAEEPEPDPETVALNRAVKPFRSDSLRPREQASRNSDVAVPDATAPRMADVNLRGIGSPVAPPPPTPGKKAPAAGGQIEEAKLISGRPPEYPRQARDARVSGAVELEVTIGPDGKVKSVHALKGDPRLRDAAMRAVMDWVYKPTMLNGKPVESQRQIVLNFKP